MSALHTSVDHILQTIRPAVQTLNAEERLALIEAIAAIERQPSEQDALLVEQNAWYARPKSERQPYLGQYVAVSNSQVVDHDSDRRELYMRVRKRFAGQTVLIVYADWDEPPTLTFYSPGRTILLGRNVLNKLVVLLDGPEKRSDILERRPARL